MSDLLSRMIRRASGAPSPIEPLLASRYEPRAPAVDAPSGEEAKSARRVEKSPAPRDVGQDREVSEEELPERSEPKAAAERRDKGVPRRVPLPAESVAMPVRNALVRERRERVVETASLPAPGAPPELPLASAGLREIRVETSERSATDRHTETHVLEKAPPPAAAAPRIETFAPQAPQSGDIEITIGHIELRMAAPPRPAPQAQPRPRPAQSRLSLDDYLRRRNGGGR